MNNILTTLLSFIDFRFTGYTISSYQNNPSKDTLLGLSVTLSSIGIESIGYRLSSPMDLDSIKTPFVTIKENKFIVVTMFSKDIIRYLNGKHEVITDIQSFKENWSHTVLAITKINNREEPNYSIHKNIELKVRLAKYTLFICGFLAIFLLGVYSRFWESQSAIGLVLFNFIGLFLSTLLYANYLNLNSNIATKLCNITSESNCEAVSKSRGAKILKLIHLSEIGCAFFITNILAILVFNIDIAILLIVSLTTIPFCIWSPIYQKYIVKKWCPLCLTIVAILILQFTYIFALNSHILYEHIIISQTTFAKFSLVILINCLLALIIFFLSRHYKQHQRNRYARLDCIKIKYNPEVFKIILNKEPSLQNFPRHSLVFGNDNSNNSITVISNPFCTSCIAIHHKLNKLSLTDYRIDYIFTASSADLLIINQYIIAYYKAYGRERAWDLLTKWYECQDKSISFFRNISVDFNNSMEDSLKHLDWIEEEKIDSTPTIFINRQRLPSQYDVSDIIYFI